MTATCQYASNFSFILAHLDLWLNLYFILFLIVLHDCPALHVRNSSLFLLLMIQAEQGFFPSYFVERELVLCKVALLHSTFSVSLITSHLV